MTQTSVTEQGVPFEGLIASGSPDSHNYIAGVDMVPGVLATYDVSEGGSQSTVELPSGALGVPAGIVLHSHPDAAKFDRADTTNLNFQAGDAVALLKQGKVWVRVEDAVAAGGDVFVRHTAAGAEQLGAFRSDADGTDAAQLTGAKFDTAAGAGELAMVSINIA